MNVESVPKSAFVMHCGLFEFVRMPFGMCNTSATFQCLMEIVLSGLLWKECFTCFDDVLVSSPDFESHLAHLQEVFDQLRRAVRITVPSCLRSTLLKKSHNGKFAGRTLC